MPKFDRLAQHQKDRIRKLHEDGKSVLEIAEILRVDRSTVHRNVKRMGLKLHGQKTHAQSHWRHDDAGAAANIPSNEPRHKDDPSKPLGLKLLDLTFQKRLRDKPPFYGKHPKK
jgi:IS30 family transposase